MEARYTYENPVLVLPVVSLLVSVLMLMYFQYPAESVDSDYYRRELEQALRDTGGRETLRTISYRMPLAASYRKEKRYDDAERMYSKIISACRDRSNYYDTWASAEEMERKYPPGSGYVRGMQAVWDEGTIIEPLRAYSDMLNEMGRTGEAKRFEDEARSIFEKQEQSKKYTRGPIYYEKREPSIVRGTLLRHK